MFEYAMDAEMDLAPPKNCLHWFTFDTVFTAFTAYIAYTVHTPYSPILTLPTQGALLALLIQWPICLQILERNAIWQGLRCCGQFPAICQQKKSKNNRFMRQKTASPHFGRTWRPNYWHQVNTFQIHTTRLHCSKWHMVQIMMRNIAKRNLQSLYYSEIQSKVYLDD